MLLILVYEMIDEEFKIQVLHQHPLLILEKYSFEPLLLNI